MSNYKGKVVYQIYPRSFQDSNHDGIGDLKGIIHRLDYLKFLNVDYVWLSPIYASHQYDYGYDIDDYYHIDPSMGTMEDFEALVAKAKALNIGIIMDMVANHTSIHHPWFKEAISDHSSPKRDYYFFKEAKNGIPNNWMSAFGGSAWQNVQDDYVLAMFTPQQVDLNWENQAMRKELYQAMRFWMDKGISGFRLDVINIISKKEGLPDMPGKGLQFPEPYLCSLEKSHEYIKEMNREVFSHYPDCFTVGEGMLVSLESTKQYANSQQTELQMMFHFDLSLIGCGELGKYDFRKMYRWSITDFKEIIRKWQNELNHGDFWMANYLSNHDFPRQVSRFGNDQLYREESAKGLALLNLSLMGTPFIYQGEEIGMTNADFEIQDWRDYEAINDYKVLQSMMHLPRSIAKRIINRMTRDHARTPMQWDVSDYGGFSSHQPWIKVNSNYKKINVMRQLMDPSSILNFYRDLIALFHDYSVFTDGQYIELLKEHKQVIAFRRFTVEQNIAVFVNMSSKDALVKLPEEILGSKVLLKNYPDFRLKKDLVLRPYEAFLILVNI